MSGASRAFSRLAIVNRGEAAMRLIHAVREYNRENHLGTDAIHTIAFYTEPDRGAMFVREADEAVNLGSATFTDAAGQRKNRYLDYAALERALIDSRADAVWVGWGFVAEHPAFADLCAELGVTFIGPDGDVMRRLGDKINSKRIAEQADVPVAPWSGGAVETLDDARVQAEKIGYPLMIKATAGGGGRGIRAVRSAGDLAEAFERARSEAAKGFGDATVFMERLVEGARHIEVQVIADHHDTVWAVGVRDCSVQRRNQKLVEESASPVLDAEQEEAVEAAAVRLCREAGYRNAGTVEFLFDPREKSFAFMEVNARLQVEHPVTEVVTGLDLVKLQLHVAAGGRLEGTPPPPRGHAIEVRLNAEDADNDFAPAPGTIELWRLPTGAGIRVDTGVEVGDSIPAEFDSMIAKLIAVGRDRNEALARLSRALAECSVVVRGGTTNKAFLYDLLSRPEVRDGSADVGWLDRVGVAGAGSRRSGAEVAVIQAAIEVYEIEFDAERRVFLASAARGRPKLPVRAGRTVELRYAGDLYRLAVHRLGGQRYRVVVDDEPLGVVSEPIGPFERRITIDDEVHRTLSVADGIDFMIEVDGVPHRISRDDNGIVRSPAPAVVVALKVAPGDDVERGDTLAVLEAMKLEMQVTAPFAGKVRRIDVANNEQVDSGAPLMRLKPAAGETESVASRPPLDFSSLRSSGEAAASVRARCKATLTQLRHLVLGFDVDPAATTRLLEERVEICGAMPPADPELLAEEDRLLAQFVDLEALSVREPEPELDMPVATGRSPRESLVVYLRALDTRGEGLSSQFLDRLRRALAHYRIDDLEHTPQLEEVLFWIFKAHGRAEHQVPAVLSVLQRRLEQVDAIRSAVQESFRGLLDRLIAVTRGRFQAIEDLAQELRYELFDKPHFEEARRKVYDEVESNLLRLGEKPDASERARLLEALIECPQPMMARLLGRSNSGDAEVDRAILEIIVRRHYRIRHLRRLRVDGTNDRRFALAEYDHEGKRIHLVATHGSLDELAAAGRAVLPYVAAVPDDCDVVVDFYLTAAPSMPLLEDADALSDRIAETLRAIGFPRPIRRIVVVAASAAVPRRFFTFRPAAGGVFREETLYRGLHPMMAKRLEVWRLSNFDIERLPSVEDVYLFRGVARENPKDARLFALVEVRDATPLHDDKGRLTAIPHLERMLLEALAAIRRWQAVRPVCERLHWNRVMLNVWPPLLLSGANLGRIVRKLTPSTVGLGLQKVVVRARIPDDESGDLRDVTLHLSNPAGRRVEIDVLPPQDRPINSLTPYRQKVVKMLQRGLSYPYEIVRLLAPSADAAESDFPPGSFSEYDLDEAGMLVPVDRPHGENRANIVVGVVSNVTASHPEGMQRVILLGDPTQGLGSLAEAECTRIVAGLDLAETMQVPLEWFAISAGARISMESGTENMDWIALVLRRIVDFTQAGGEINVVVHGINVGAQPYWNAEATMLMHTRGILIETRDGAMVLTGKQALDYSGSVSAEDNFGIGGYDRIMGPNGQAQYWAADLDEACRILLQHYEYTYLVPGEPHPRRVETSDPIDRDVCKYPYVTEDAVFATVGDVFSPEKNPGRKRPFDIRHVMQSVIDQDHEPLERWSAWHEAEIGVVWDARVGGYPVCMLGFESKPLTRAGFVPADGPERWTAGTLFPQASRKIARAINAATANRPLVVLANLSGFDGSPESMRRWQLEYGAEIGRAVVNFRGPIVFVVISRYHGGAFVVFSKRLSDTMEVAALEHTHASVIGGAPAAAVVFARDVKTRTNSDPRLRKLQKKIDAAPAADRGGLRTQMDELYRAVYSEKLGEVAEEFDAIHNVDRALRVGSIDRILPANELRPYVVDAIERGLRKAAELATDAGAATRGVEGRNGRGAAKPAGSRRKRKPTPELSQ